MAAPDPSPPTRWLHAPSRQAYRNSDHHDEHLVLAAERPLREAHEALHLAVLCLEGEDDDPDHEGARQPRAVQARGFLVEAVRALGHARLYLPAIRVYSVPVILAVDPDEGAELARLHQIATRLLWYNHAWLPARDQARPLQPHEEAQLAVLLRGLARSARTGRALRHAWLATAVMVAVVAPTFGIVAVSLLLATVVVAAAALQIGRAASPALDEPTSG
ncbi:MAG: hypothetical protein JNL82_14250 [Myxococcales bacterium]|nr:hypothetical protein [Myxococcales bacterium]